MHVRTNRQLLKFITKVVQLQTWIYPMGLVWKDNMHPQCQLSRRAWTWAWGPTTPSPTAALKHPTNPDCRLQHSLAALLQNRWLLTGHRCSSEWKNGWPYAPARHSTWRRGCRALARLSLSRRPGILCFHWGPSLCCLPSLQGKNPVCVGRGQLGQQFESKCVQI